MFIDRILSRFNIQTKVLMFILPFVVSISAVGLTGLWASGLLQGRIEISNSVLRSLSGFRDVSTSMNLFLAETTEQGRDDVKSRLTAQRDVLKAMFDQLPDNTKGRAELEAASTLIDEVTNHVDNLWSLHETESGAVKTIQKGLSVVVNSQVNINEALKKVQRTISDDDAAAKRTLREAENIRAMGAFLLETAGTFAKASASGEKATVLLAALPEMKKRLRVLAISLPAANKSTAKAIEKLMGDLNEMVDANDTSDASLTDMTAKVNGLKQFSTDLSMAAEQKMSEATGKFGQLDAPLEKATGVLNDGRQLMTSGYSIQIVMARFLLAPTEENRTRLDQEFKSMRKEMAKLKEKAGDLLFYAELEKKLLPALDATEVTSLDLVKISQERKASFDKAADDLNVIWKELTSFAELQKQSASDDRQQANSISIGTTALGISIWTCIGKVERFS